MCAKKRVDLGTRRADGIFFGFHAAYFLRFYFFRLITGEALGSTGCGSRHAFVDKPLLQHADYVSG